MIIDHWRHCQFGTILHCQITTEARWGQSVCSKGEGTLPHLNIFTSRELKNKKEVKRRLVTWRCNIRCNHLMVPFLMQILKYDPKSFYCKYYLSNWYFEEHWLKKCRYKLPWRFNRIISQDFFSLWHPFQRWWWNFIFNIWHLLPLSCEIILSKEFEVLWRFLTLSEPDSEDTEEAEECWWGLEMDMGESALCGDEESRCASSDATGGSGSNVDSFGVQTASKQEGGSTLSVVIPSGVKFQSTFQTGAGASWGWPQQRCLHLGNRRYLVLCGRVAPGPCRPTSLWSTPGTWSLLRSNGLSCPRCCRWRRKSTNTEKWTFASSFVIHDRLASTL